MTPQQEDALLDKLDDKFFEEQIEPYVQKRLKEQKETILKVIQGNYVGTFTDDAGHDCWYIDKLIQTINNI